ncbi:MAG TPA: TolC family protein, partial [Polyangiaceae bacterium]|nr:TolC family protein [Polyangiaceae bacterium]
AVLAPTPGGLTSQMVAERSGRNSSTVRARLADLDIARARLDQTLVQFLPRFSLRASYTRLSPVRSEFEAPGGGPGFAIESVNDNYALTASLNVPLSDYLLRLSHAISGSAANRRAAELQHEAEALKVRSDAQALFYDWLRAQARVSIARKTLEQTRARLKDAGPAFQLGAITKADLMRLEALVASTEQVVLEADAYRSLSELQLAVAMGDPAPRGYVVGEDINARLIPQQGTLATLTREALTSRLELRALERAASSARDAGRAMRGTSWPRLDAFGDVTYANPNQRIFPPAQQWDATWSVGAAASWTFGDILLGAAQGREMFATARSLDAQRAALVDGVRQDVAAQFLARERALGAIRTAARGLAAAQEGYRVATDLYRVGRATTTEVIAAETDLLTARLNELNARIEARIADVRLKHAVGRDIGPHAKR